MELSKNQIIEALAEIADLLEIKGENPFRIRAYRNGIQALELLSDFESRLNTGTLTEIKGIGSGLQQEIASLAKIGTSPLLSELRQQIPSGVLKILQVPGLGPKKVKSLFEDLGITNLGELEYACKENRLIELKGFGAKIQENVLKGIEHLKKSAGRFHLDVAWKTALKLKSFLQAQVEVKQSEIAGSLRRRIETIGDLDFLVSLSADTSIDRTNLMKKFVQYGEVENVLVSGPTKASVRLKNGMQADLRVVTEEEFPFALLYFTGSKGHNTALRQMAKGKGLKLSEYGLFRDTEVLKCREEAEIYQTLGLDFIPPEQRENHGEIEFAKQERSKKQRTKKAFSTLIEEKDIRGLFHAHTTWSDGSASILEMAQATQALGYEYLGLSDHSQTAFYANGLKPKNLKTQAKEVLAAKSELKNFTLWQGVESDILNDGSLDYEPDLLKQLDFVIASIHSGFKMDAAKMTRRLLHAIANPYTRFIGHISGRLLLGREGFSFDHEVVFAAAAKHGVAIEINAHPHRLDLDWRYLAQAKEIGVKFSINPDAHSTEGLKDVTYGIWMARKGGLSKNDVINTLGVEEVNSFLKREM